jgi:hypothetical protein
VLVLGAGRPALPIRRPLQPEPTGRRSALLAPERPERGILVSTRELERVRLAQERVDQEGCRRSVADNEDTSNL